MDKVLLDTDILSEILKGKNVNVTSKATIYLKSFGKFSISVVTVMEIVKGFHKMQRETRLLQVLKLLQLHDRYDFNSEISEISGRIYGDLERTGQPIGRADPMIAGTAIHHGLILVTGNTSHYERIIKLGYDLKIENWKL